MAKDPENMKGVLFDNANYKKTEKQPDWRGKVNIDGKIWEVSGWNRKSDFGELVSLAVSEPYKKGEQVEKRVAAKAQAPLEDDIPF